MIHDNKVDRSPKKNTAGVMAGMLVGGLTGAVTMLLLAPQSGKDTRKQIQEKGIELRDRTTQLVENTVAQARTTANKVSMGLKDRGQEVAIEQLDHVSEAAQAGKKAIENS